MADKFSKKKRSKIMSKVRASETKLEISFRKELWKAGFRYRKNASGYFGKPDILLKKYKAVIFIDSCFWHGCRKHFRMPQSNKKYWEIKINNNRVRDKEVNKHYKKIGWKIFRIWEHQIKKNPRGYISKILKIITYAN